MKGLRSLIWIGLFYSLVGVAVAQEAQTPPAQPETPPAEQPERKPRGDFLAEIGWMEWNLDGNENKFRQYATPPEGFFLRHLLYSGTTTSRNIQGFFDLQGLGEEDYVSEGRLALLYGTTQVEGWLTRHRFFDIGPAVLDESERRVEEAHAKQLISPDFALAVNYRADQQNRYFLPPFSPLRQLTRRWDALARGRFGPGYLNVRYTDLRYFDRTERLPDTTVRGWTFGYLWEPLFNLGLEGSYSKFNIEQPDTRRSEVESLTFAGDWSITPTTEVIVNLRRDQYSLPKIENGYVRERNSGSVSLVQRWDRWTGKFGYRLTELERVRGDQTFVDTPRWHTFEARLSGPTGPDGRLSLWAYTQTNSRTAPSVFGPDARPLYWRKRDFIQAKLDGGTPIVNGFLTFTYQRLANGKRETGLTTRAVTAGGNWEITPHVSLFAEYTFEKWTGQSEVQDSPDLDDFMSENRVIFAGLNWIIDHRTYASASFTEFTTGNANPLLLVNGNTRGCRWTFSVRHRFPTGAEIGLTVAPWTYHDRLVDLMDYDTTVVMITGSTKF